MELGTKFGAVVAVIIIILSITGVLHVDRTAEYQAKTEMMQKQEEIRKQLKEERENDHRSYGRRAIEFLIQRR